MSEEKRILLAGLREFLENRLADPMLAFGDIPPVLQEVVFHRAEQMGRLSDLRPPYCEELASLILGELCQQRFQDLCQRLGSTRKRGAAFTSLLLVRTQYLAPLLDDVDILTGSDALECLQSPECLAKVRPKDVPPALLENVRDRIQGLRGPRGQQSGAVSRHRQQGLEMLAEEIWQAYEASIPTVLGVPEPPAPEIPPPAPAEWKSRFAQRLQRTRQTAPLPEPSLPAQPLIRGETPSMEAALARRKSPEYPEEALSTEAASRLRERVPLRHVQHLVPRTALLDRVKELLLAEAGPPLIGLWGMAGGGKTALLQMLGHDPEVQRHFEALLWAELGLEADESLDAKGAKQHLREHLSLWAAALSLPAADLPTVEQLSPAIQRHLQDRRVLILLDDAWSSDSIQPFLVGSRVIVTTRNRSLLDRLDVDHEVVEIPPLTLAEAQALVQQVTGQALAQSDPRLRLLYEGTAGLPQALRMAAYRLQDLGWERVLDFLQEETSRLSLFERGEGRSRADSLRTSFALSYERLRPEQQRLFRALGALAPAPASAEAVQAVYQQESVEATELELRRLADLSLIQSQPAGDGPSLFHLSGLWRDYARELLRGHGELEPCEARYTAAQVRRAEVLSGQFQSAGEGMAGVMRAFDLARPHFDYVFRLSGQRQDAAPLHRLLSSCPPLLIHSGWLELWQEWLALLKPWLERQAPEADDAAQLYVEWCLQHAELLLHQGDAQGAVEALMDGRRPRGAEPAQEARWLLTLTSALLRLGQARKARRYLDQAQKLRLVRQDLGLRFWLHSLQAQLTRTKRIPARVVHCHGQAIAACRLAGNRADELAERLNLAESYRQFGWVEKALAQLRHVAVRAGHLELPALYLASLQQLVVLYLNAGQLREAAEAVDRLRPFSSAEVLAHLEERLQSTPQLRRNPNVGLRPELVQRIAIVGAPGSAKTALARQLSRQLGWPHVELDALYWPSRWKPVSAEAFREDTLQALRGESWIVDGNHWQVRDIVWGRADLLLWLDYSPWQTLRRIVRRERASSGNHRGSILLPALRALGRRRQEYPISLSVNGLEQLPPKVIHLDSPESAERWLSEFVASKQRQAAIERL